jgi:uncharacterized membrane protein YeaQ/YmgE (transglycosylase-associated protein family)
MAIIDLMTALMGVSMGFLAFLLIGGISGLSSWVFYPGQSGAPNPGKLLLAAFLGFIAAAVSSYFGQSIGFFQSGQMLEWFSAIFASCLVGCIFTTLAK